MRAFIGAVLLSVISASPALAWDGTVSGKIAALEVTGAQNYGFRLWLTNAPAMCGNTNGWAYSNASFDNYNALVSLLMTSWITGKTVTVFTNRDASGYCAIGYVTATG